LSDKFHGILTRYQAEKNSKKCLVSAPPTRLSEMIETGENPCEPKKLDDYCEQAQEFYLKKFMGCRHNFALRKTKEI
jgi:hypothetical protein